MSFGAGAPLTPVLNLLKKSLVKEVFTHEWERFDGRILLRKIWVHEQLRDLATHLSEGAFISHQVGCGDIERELHEANVVSYEEAVCGNTEGLLLLWQELRGTHCCSFWWFVPSSASFQVSSSERVKLYILVMLHLVIRLVKAIFFLLMVSQT
jgi:hypothetical protein